MMYYLCMVRFDLLSFCKYKGMFILFFYLPCDFFFLFWCQGNAGFINDLGTQCPLFNFLEEFGQNCQICEL